MSLPKIELKCLIDELQKNNQELGEQKRKRTFLRILKILLIGFFIGKGIDKKISELEMKQESIIRRLKDFIHKEISGVAEEVENIKNSRTYLMHADKERVILILTSVDADLAYLQTTNMIREDFILSNRKKLEEYQKFILDYNNEFIKQRKIEWSHLFDKENLSFDEEQKDAVITDDKYNLVVAGAGSGKTEVLITRIAYLIQRKPDNVLPKKILAIAYQRKAKEEIQQRLQNHYKITDVNVTTFHKLGKDILEKTGGKIRHIDIIDENKKHAIIKSIFENKLKSDQEYYKLFLQYVKKLHDIEQDESFKDEEGSLAYMRQRPYFSVNGANVKSRAEKEIMDFFLTHKLNGMPITIEYEPNTDFFEPDFRLVDYDLYIEHWGLDEKGQVPDWFTQSTEEYEKVMEKKKEWFAEHNKLLVETFTYEYSESNLEEFAELLKNRVIAKLQARHNCKFEITPMTYEEIVRVAWGPYKNPIDDIVNFVTNAKTYGLTPEKIMDRLHNQRWSAKQLAFGMLAVKIYSNYEEELHRQNKIDFEDMITKAIKELTNDNNLYSDIYDHILIDEYQDISAQRFLLIKKLLEHNPKCKLFCVGDDWQSIMGFAGSNLSFFVNFDEYFKNPVVTKLSTNYRSIKSIVDAGADLIKNNGHNQIQKLTLSNRNNIKPIRVFKSPHKEEFERRYYGQIAEDCLDRIINYLQNGFEPKDILILTRYMRTRTNGAYKFVPLVKKLIERARERGIEIAFEQVHAENKVRLLTAHKSKGLEAKVVFILNVIKGTYGFPCEIEDPLIYAPARENYPQQDQRQEERRLFYVAMTRAKDDLVIYTWEPLKSEFIQEINNHISEERLTY
jgi:DNA helicase-4